MSAQSRLNEILKQQRFVRLAQFYRGMRAPELIDTDTGRVLLRTRSYDLMRRKVQQNGWHVVQRITSEPASLSPGLVTEGWRSLESAPEREPVQVYLRHFMKEYEAPAAFVLVHSTWFVVDPFEHWDFPFPIAWQPWTNDLLVVGGSDRENWMHS